MFPIRDHNPSLSTPFVTRALVLLNVLIWLYQWSLSSDPHAEGQFYRAWAMFPVLVTQNGEWHGLLTSMFLHGGFWHLAGNMLFLWIFGDNLEDQMGHTGFLAFYLASGILAGLAQVAFEPMSKIPTVGASGAIAGVMGGYLLLFPARGSMCCSFSSSSSRSSPCRPSPCWASGSCSRSGAGLPNPGSGPMAASPTGPISAASRPGRS